MSVIHRTTLVPTKMEFLGAWLPEQPWYRGGGAPDLAKVGGFRLDDPAGEVGIEFMVAADASGPEPVYYHVPLTYRGAPLDEAQDALITTAEHGVLGSRWVYDGTRDPVLVARLAAFLQGRAAAQAQSESDTPDPSVTAVLAWSGPDLADASAAVANSAQGTKIVLTVPGRGAAAEPATLVIRVNRVLAADGDRDAEPAEAEKPVGHITAGWKPADETAVRGQYFTAFEESAE